MTPKGDVRWGVVTESGEIDQTREGDGPKAGEVYVVSGYDDRWSEPAIYLAEFPSFNERDPGYGVSHFRPVAEEELDMVKEMMKKLRAKA